MPLPPCFSRFSRRNVLAASALLTLALGCSPTMEIQCVLETKSCTDNAQTMIFRMQSTSPYSTLFYDGGTPNVLGIHSVFSNNNLLDVHVVTDLDNAMLGDPVAVKFTTHVNVASTLTVSLSDVAFFKLPSYDNPDVPDCGIIQAPYFKITQGVPQGLELQVGDASATPLTLVSLDLVEAPQLLPISALDWNDPSFNALPWQPAITGSMVLDPASPPLTINLPAVANGGPAVLCRFVSVYDGQEIRGIMQGNLDSPLKTQSTTWGKVKSLYRN